MPGSIFHCGCAGCRAAAGVSRTVAATLEGLGMWGAKPAPAPANTLPGALAGPPALKTC